MLGTLSHIGIYTNPPNVPGVVCFGHIRDALEVKWSDAVDNNEQCTVVLPPMSRGISMVGNRRVLALHFTAPLANGTGARRVFRIFNVTTEKSAQGLRTIVQARSLAYDFADAGPVAFVYSGGFQSFSISGSLAGHQWWDTYVEPHLALHGYGFYSRTALFSNLFAVRATADRWTAMQFLDAYRQQTEFEWQLVEYFGQWLVDFTAKRINATLLPILIKHDANANSLTRQLTSTEQATVIVPIGGAGHSDSTRTIQHYFAQEVNTRDYANKIIEFFSISLQGVDLVGKYLQRNSTGRCFLIVGQGGANGSHLTLDALTTVGSYDAEHWEFRESLTPATPIDVPTTPFVPLRVNGTPSGLAVVVDNPFNGNDPSPTNDVHIDCRARFSPVVLATTCSNVAAVAGSTTDLDLTFASLTGVAVGDWGFLANSASPSWVLFSKVYDVIQLVSGTVARVRCRYSYDAGTLATAAGAISKQAQFYRARTNIPYVNDEVASTNTLTVSSIAGLASGDLVEYFLDNSGAMLTGMPSALAADPPVGYGIARREKEFPDHRVIHNMLYLRNPWFDVFVGSVPFAWSVISGSTTQLTTSLPGPGTTYAVRLNGNSLLRLTDPINVRPTSGDSKVSLRAQIRTPSVASWTGSVSFTMAVETSAAALQSIVCVPPDHPSPPAGSQSVDPSTVATVDLLAVDMLVYPSAGVYPPWNGIKISFQTSGSVLVDIGGVMLLQDSTLPPNGELILHTDQDLWDLGKLALSQFEAPQQSNAIDATAVQQLLQGTSAQEFVKGRTVRVFDPDLGVFEDRIMACDYSADQSGTVKVQVRTRVDDISQLLARQLIARR